MQDHVWQTLLDEYKEKQDAHGVNLNQLYTERYTFISTSYKYQDAIEKLWDRPDQQLSMKQKYLVWLQEQSESKKDTAP